MLLKEIFKKYKNEIDEILNALKYCDFESLDCNYFDDLICDFKQNYNKNFTADNGATKGVLIFEDFGFVIKIPFCYCDEEELCGAEEGNDYWDYCSQEVARYEAAKNQGLGNVFLEVEFLDFINNYPIYIQPYAAILSHIQHNYKEKYSSSNDEDIKRIEKLDEDSLMPPDWEADLYVIYGKDFFIKVKNYIKDNFIEDLRKDNVGYINKQPVLVDYAGYNS